ncbi:chromate transporter [Coprinopsis cinerea okayama7|uniref:Chromate transporter n=1 Tax=Coprinopsis cinerea (strain Okayama-7 / 130 / ATCC MYA-4618 / FGSC 9003) TaxID=240176 RepID=D6RKU8_COPC7|nr:chromate transporter [Coprinopsis cinerea okayama7\|eukprot:XP_002911996.1 chromate transporter [Coprinopsis cinerea okayama7\
MSFSALVNRGIQRAIGRTPDDAEDYDRANGDQAYQANTSKLSTRLWDVLCRTFDLGFIGFGGPPVHFQIFHRRFVEGMGKTPWIDEQTYQEIFAICQALPGPGSTKMLFTIAQIHAGLLPAIFVFLLWSLPAGIAMYGLALGVQRISTVLPEPVYALLSGLNAATVGIIALAAVQLSRKAITDQVTRLLVVMGACAGMCYNALWYFPVLMVIAGIVTVVWDMWLRGSIARFKERRKRVTNPSITPEPLAENGMASPTTSNHHETDMKADAASSLHRRQPQTNGSDIELVERTSTADGAQSAKSASPTPTPKHELKGHGIPVKYGLALIVLFWAAFTALMVVRGTLDTPPLLLALFNNMFLAGTIIFGGGPVVIPLLREYVVEPGWVSPRDFLLGLAIIQAMPGPNFNFAVYLGALAVLSDGGSKSPGMMFVGALLAFIGIFTPGIWLSVGFQSIWRALRSKPIVTSLLRGVNAGAVGLVFTAVYRLWEIGFLTVDSNRGVSLGKEPWWLVVAASTFTGVEWFSVPPPVAIMLGGVAGLAWYGVVSQ